MEQRKRRCCAWQSREAAFLWNIIRMRRRQTLDMPISMRTANSITMPNTLSSVFHTATGVISNRIMGKTWNTFWKGLLPYSNILAVSLQKSGLIIPRPLLLRSSKVEATSHGTVPALLRTLPL